MVKNNTNLDPVPKFLKEIASFINPVVKDEESFQYSIVLSKRSGSNYNRKSNLKSALEKFTFDNINYPLQKQDYKTFEQNNPSITLVIYEPDEYYEVLNCCYKSNL